MKTKEELHLVMTAPPPPPPPVYEPVSYHVQESPQEEGAEPMGYSAELCSEGILDHRNEEKRITEAEKNERVQRQLLVSMRTSAGGAWLGFHPGRWLLTQATQWTLPTLPPLCLSQGRGLRSRPLWCPREGRC